MRRSPSEFNFWFDPEAAHIVLSAHWPKVTCVPVDIAIKTHFTRAMAEEIARSAHYARPILAEVSCSQHDYMWDELAASAWMIPPSSRAKGNTTWG